MDRSVFDGVGSVEDVEFSDCSDCFSKKERKKKKQEANVKYRAAATTLIPQGPARPERPRQSCASFLLSLNEKGIEKKQVIT